MAWMTGVMTMTSEKTRYFLPLNGAKTPPLDVYAEKGRRAEQFAARADEYTEVQVVPLDAVVVNLPAVRRTKIGGWVPDGPTNYGVYSTPRYTEHSDAELNVAEESALLLLAAIKAERAYRADPPVDEEQVKALADALDEIDDPSDKDLQADWRVVARRLVERGVRVEARPNEQG